MSEEECTEIGYSSEKFEEEHQRALDLKSERSGTTGYECRVLPGLFGNSFWDEAHTLKNTESQRVTTLLALKIKRVLLMTASPFVNRLRDLATILHIVHETGGANKSRVR